MKKRRSKKKRYARKFYFSMVAAFMLVISLGVSYGYALHLSDVTGVTGSRTGGYEDNSGYLDGDTGQGEPVIPRARAHIVVWGKANNSDVSVDGRQGYDDLDHVHGTDARP